MKTFTELRETLTFAGRKKLSRAMKRRKNPMKLARKRADKKVAPNEKLISRAQRNARKRVADHITRGKDKSKMSAVAKSNLEKRVKAKSGLVKQYVRKELPKVRKRDRS